MEAVAKNLIPYWLLFAIILTFLALMHFLMVASWDKQKIVAENMVCQVGQPVVSDGRIAVDIDCDGQKRQIRHAETVFAIMRSHPDTITCDKIYKDDIGECK
jgi:hypothetical protein